MPDKVHKIILTESQPQSNYTVAGEVTGSLFMAYVDGKEALTWLDQSNYGNGKVLVDVSHFSTYGVAYKTSVPVFTGIASHWSKEDIEFVAARVCSPAWGNQFSPDDAMTRGMFVTAQLPDTYDVDSHTGSSFYLLVSNTSRVFTPYAVLRSYCER